MTSEGQTVVLAHPAGLDSGRFLVLPHPRSLAAVYVLPCSTGLLELSTVSGATPRSLFLSNDTVVADGKLAILSPVDALFFVLPVLMSGGERYVPYDDVFESAATALGRQRTSNETVWQDVARLAAVPDVKDAVRRCCDVQDLGNGLETFRLSKPKLFAILTAKLERLSTQEIFDKTPNTLGRQFDRLHTDDVDPARTRRTIALQTVTAYLQPSLAKEWTATLDA